MRYLHIDHSTGWIMTLTKPQFENLLYMLLIVGTLELAKYEKIMAMRKHRRKQAEQEWKQEAQTKLE